MGYWNNQDDYLNEVNFCSPIVIPNAFLSPTWVQKEVSIHRESIKVLDLQPHKAHLKKKIQIYV